MNYKSLGDIGQNVAIGELAKYQVGVAFPLSDNFPFDLVLIAGTKLFRAQVKSSSEGQNGDTVIFGFTTSNFYTGEIKGYDKTDVDVIIGVDLRTFEVYLFDDFEGRHSLTIRKSEAKNNQSNCNWQHDYIIGPERVKQVFGHDPINMDHLLSKRLAKKYQHTCGRCHAEFENGHKNAKYCGKACRQEAAMKVDRPSKADLQNDIKTLSWKSIGRKYGVSDNAIRKWARKYELI